LALSSPRTELSMSRKAPWFMTMVASRRVSTAHALA
jgi:hypothetical protein